MELKIVENENKYYEFIRILRTHEKNSSGFLEQVQITPEQQEKYMENHKGEYYICLDENDIPVGWVGSVKDDIRICTHPNFKGNGIGKYMLNELMVRVPTAHAKVLIGNTRSENLFLACNFEEYKVDEKYKYYKR